MMPTRQNTEVPADWLPPMAPTREATVVDHAEIPAEPPQERLAPKRKATEADHADLPADPPQPRRESSAPDEAETAPEPDAKKPRTGLQIAIPYTASGDPEEHRKQREHILACVARAAIETIQESLAKEKPEAEDSADAKPKTINITVAGNFFPDTKTGKVHVQDKAA